MPLDLISLAIGIGIGASAAIAYITFEILTRPEPLQTQPTDELPPRPAAPPNATDDWKHYCAGDPECTMIVGVLKGVVKEGNGDFHILVDVLPEYKRLLNPPNMVYQHGYLVVQAAKEDENKFVVPHPETKVQVVGPLIKDPAYSWMEINPVRFIGVY